MSTPLAPEIPSLDTFGGTFVNADAVVDPTTECDASFFNRLLAQVVMLSHTAPKAWVSCTVSGGTVTIVDHDAVWGNTSAVKPTVARTGAGIFTVTWASSYSDLQSTPETHSLSIRACDAGGYAATPVFFNYTITGTTQVTVLSLDAAGSSADPDEFTVRIW